jgi:hypothetical protein
MILISGLFSDVKTEIAAKNVGASAPHHQLKAADFELYAHVLQNYDAKRTKSEDLADTPEVRTHVTNT